MSKSEVHRVPPYKRPIIVGGFLLIAVVVSIISFSVFRSLNQDQEDNSPDTNQSTSTSKPNNNTQDTPNSEEPLENKAPQYEGEDPNLSNTLTGVITYIDVDMIEQIIHSAVQIDQYLQADGQCVMNLKRDDTILRTASVVAEPDVTTSVCGPFRISIDGLATGEYQLEVIITGDGKRGIISENVSI